MNINVLLRSPFGFVSLASVTLCCHCIAVAAGSQSYQTWGMQQRQQVKNSMFNSDKIIKDYVMDIDSFFF